MNNVTKVTLIIMAVFMILLSGCNQSERVLDPEVPTIVKAERMVVIANNAKDSVNKATSKVKSIKEEAQEPVPDTVRIEERASGALDDLDYTNELLGFIGTDAKDVKKETKESQEEYAKAVKAKEKAESKANASTKNRLNWAMLVALAFVGLSVAYSLITKDWDNGITAAISFTVIAILAMIMSQWMLQIAIGCGIAAVGYLGYTWYEYRKKKEEAEDHRKSLEEVVVGNQDFLDHMPKDVTNTFKEIQKKAQTFRTTGRVKEIAQNNNNRKSRNS